MYAFGRTMKTSGEHMKRRWQAQGREDTKAPMKTHHCDRPEMMRAGRKGH